MAPKIQYNPLSAEMTRSSQSSDDSYDLDSVLLSKEIRSLPRSTRTARRLLPWILHGTSILTCVAILLYASFVNKKDAVSCVKKHNYYSPMNDAISDEYVELTFDGSLWYNSPYKGPPTPEVNQAWHNLMRYGAISATADDILRIGHNLSAVQYPPEAGGGYLGVAVGTHHIHCLHYIWQDHHINHFPETQANKKGVPEMYERHYEHCVDYIRQGLMCNFDPGLLPYNWVLDHNQPTPNANTRHKCVNWEYLQTWLQKRAVEIPPGFEWKQPLDAESLAWNP